MLDALPEELAELFRELEDTLLHEICTRLKAGDQLNEVTVQDIRALRSHGIDLKDIKKAIQKTSGIADDKLNKLLDDVVERNQKYYREAIDLAGLTQPETLLSIEDRWAIYEQTRQELRNITRSMGFLVDHGRTMLKPAKAYQWACDNAVLQVQSGAISYNQAISDAVKQLAESGLKTVNYESGHVDRVDIAVRRAVLTGVNQLNRKYSEQSMDFLETDLVQVEAHSGARDIDGPKGWENHKAWQGRVYKWAAFTRRYPNASKGHYKDFEQTCGYGDVQGIQGANCRHSWTSFVEGVMEPTYTDEYLAHIDDGMDCDFDGKHYSAYQATQMQRRLERQIRAQKRLKNAYKDAGLTDEAKTANIKLRRLNAKYKEFSAAAGLREKTERLKVTYTDDKSIAKAQQVKAQKAEAAALKNKENTAILGSKISSGEISTQIRPQVQAKHIEGTAQFEEYRSRRLAKGQTPQSILTVSEQEAQELVSGHHCTGDVVVQRQKDGAVKITEYCDADKVIGRYYEENAYHDAKRFGIYYSKKGTHIVPTPPKGEK